MYDVYQRVRVFDKNNEAEGNLAAIFADEQKGDEISAFTEVSINIKNQHNIATTCFIRKIIDERYVVRCFNSENEIQCCGHGMIAAAKVIFLKYDLDEINLNGNLISFAKGYQGEKNKVSLMLPRILSHVQNIPGWIGDSISFNGDKLQPSHSAISDKDDGYLLFEFEPALSLDRFSSLQLDLKQVCMSTKRAVVLLQFEEKKKHLYLRYFAPQYGVLEDAATGSVMRFVADYIEKKYKCSRFDVSQCSYQGGFMRVECKKEKIIITANVTIET